MIEGLPAKDLVKYEAGVLDFEEDVIALEDLLQVAIAKLSDEVDMVKVIDALTLGDPNLYHPHDVWMLAIL